MQPEEVHQRQMRTGIEHVVRRIVQLMRQPTPEQAHISRREGDLMIVHPIVYAAAHDEVDFDLGMPMRLEHYQRTIVKHQQSQRQTLHAARAWPVKRSLRYLTFRQVHVPFVTDSRPPSLVYSWLQQTQTNR